MKLPNPLFIILDIVVLAVLVWELWRLKSGKYDRNKDD